MESLRAVCSAECTHDRCVRASCLKLAHCLTSLHVRWCGNDFLLKQLSLHTGLSPISPLDLENRRSSPENSQGSCMKPSCTQEDRVWTGYAKGINSQLANTSNSAKNNSLLLQMLAFQLFSIRCALCPEYICTCVFASCGCPLIFDTET